MPLMECDLNLNIIVEWIGRRQRVTAAVGGNVLHVDTLDLASATSRKRFVKALLEKAEGLDREAIDAELLRLAASTPQSPPDDAIAPAVDPRIEALASMPADIRDEADKLLADPELIRRVCDDVASLGVAGERELALTIYLIGTSRPARETAGWHHPRFIVVRQIVHDRAGCHAVPRRDCSSRDTDDPASAVPHAARRTTASVGCGGRTVTRGR